ncbi:hypothetical protein RIF29_19070 [Crotalaria pallida]|uniref:Uncharacterized protein n=1 Tax=Crotalaria pallida TaxID=3830 RepID=A0AAN9IB37_CROPI
MTWRAMTKVKLLIAAVIPPSFSEVEENLAWAMENNGEFSIAFAAKLCQDLPSSTVFMPRIQRSVWFGDGLVLRGLELSFGRLLMEGS